MERQKVPQALLPDCPDKLFTGATIGQLIEYNADLLGAYQNCQTDVEALKMYLREQQD